jgi:hypothetical protein
VPDTLLMDPGGLSAAVAKSAGGGKLFEALFKRRDADAPPVYHTVLDAGDPLAPNVIIWPPGAFHELTTPGPYSGLHFYTLPPSVKLLQQSALWCSLALDPTWQKELKSASVDAAGWVAWYGRAAAAVRRHGGFDV